MQSLMCFPRSENSLVNLYLSAYSRVTMLTAKRQNSSTRRCRLYRRKMPRSKRWSYIRRVSRDGGTGGAGGRVAAPPDFENQIS